MVNLLRETKEALKEKGKSPSEVLWIGLVNGGDLTPCWFTWDSFAALAQQVDYNNGYGTQYIPDSLMVVGEDWWLERLEYDGSECWGFQTKPERPVHYVETIVDPRHLNSRAAFMLPSS